MIRARGWTVGTPVGRPNRRAFKYWKSASPAQHATGRWRPDRHDARLPRPPVPAAWKPPTPMTSLDSPHRPFAPDRGVSPVIGVILMVAVTVVLAAVVGTFVLDLGQVAGGDAPSASLRVTADAPANNLTITHAGGDGLLDGRTRIAVTNETGGAEVTFEPGPTDEVFSVGDRVVVNVTSPGGGGPATIGPSGDAFASRTATDGGYFDGGLRRGMRYTVQVVDTRSQRVIFETTVTA